MTSSFNRNNIKNNNYSTKYAKKHGNKCMTNVASTSIIKHFAK